MVGSSFREKTSYTFSLYPVATPFFLTQIMDSSSAASVSSLDRQNLDLHFLQRLVLLIEDYVDVILCDANAWNSLKKACTIRLNLQNRDLFEFSDRTIFSNLYCGILSIEAAIQSRFPEENLSHLRESEMLLQLPVSLDETHTTAGIPNRSLVCFSYFYLSLVHKLQYRTWHAAIHFLQALLVSPWLVRTEIAPDVCARLYLTCSTVDLGETDTESTAVDDLKEDYISRILREMAGRYKSWLTYYQVMSYGEARSQDQLRGLRSHCHQSKRRRQWTSKLATQSKLKESQTYCERKKVHPLDFNNDRTNQEIEAKTPDLPCNMKLEDQASTTTLQEMLTEPQSGTISTSHTEDEDNFSEDKEIIDLMKDARLKTENMWRPAPQLSRQKGVSEAYVAKLQFFKSKSSLLWSNLQHCELQPPWRTFSQHENSDDKLSFRLNEPSLLKEKRCNKSFHHPRRVSKRELVKSLEKMISDQWFLEVVGDSDVDYSDKASTICTKLSRKAGARYTLLLDVILEQLLVKISTSKKVTVIKASMSILTAIILADKAALEEVKKKGLQLSDLASALKQNVQEAAILIYLINPSPAEIESHKLLPILLEVASASICDKSKPLGFSLTPTLSALMTIELLATSFDRATTNTCLATISSPNNLCGLLSVTQKEEMRVCISLAKILVKCMQFEGDCRKNIFQHIDVNPFVCLLQSCDEWTKQVALEFFHEVLRIPRSSAIKLLQQILGDRCLDIFQTLMLSTQLQSKYRIFAAELLLQLNALDYTSVNQNVVEEAITTLVMALTSESSSVQLLSSVVLTNLGGTYSWAGEPYTVAWLLKKGGLTSLYQKNIIRSFDWSDESLQDGGLDGWCNRVARSITSIGEPLFLALKKGLLNKSGTVSKDSLTTISWLGFGVVNRSENIKYQALEILLSEIEQLLHPGIELEKRLLACLSIYNYTTGTGMQKLIHFSEGVRESLRRLSHLTWMANELHEVTDYLSDKSRISCVHTQILEMHQSCSGAVTTLIYYKGLLCSGYSDGSIKVWEIKGKSALLVWNIKKHKKAVTCFSLFEPGESLLSVSTDKTVRVWQMLKGKLVCVDVIATGDPMRRVESYGSLIFVITHGYKLKLLDSSRTLKSICKGKRVKCTTLFQGKVYMGCTDASIHELSITSNRERELKAPLRGFRLQSKPITSITVYRDWLYNSSSHVEGANIKDLRRNCDPQMIITPAKGASILAMEVVEDFIYVNQGSSASTLQIWLRKTLQKVGRLSAGSKITSLLAANDVILCGTEAGAIKGWIPL